MYNPSTLMGDDSDLEWIELYNNGLNTIDLSNWLINDKTFDDVNISKEEYVVLARQLTDDDGDSMSFEAYYGNNDSIWDSNDGDYKAVDGDFSFKNSGDAIILKNNNGTLFDTISYTDTCKSGYSLEYLDGSFYCSFYPGGTPGKPNSNKGKDYSNIIINEFFPNPAGDDNAPMPGGEFIELYNKGNNNTDLAGLYLQDSANHKLYIVDTTTIDGTLIETRGYLAVYMNEFSGFLNNDGFEEIKLYDPYRNLIDKVNYANSKESLSWSLVDNIWQYRLPSPNKINLKKEVKTKSSFKIEGLEDVSNNESEFGDIIKVKFHVYKGNTTKRSIKLYIKNDEHRITKITKANLANKYTDYGLTLPIPIKSNCNQKYEDGDYYVEIGWTSSSKAEDTFKIKLKGINMDNCDKIYVERKPRKGTLNHNLVEIPGKIELNKDFTMKIELTNNDGQDHMVDIYSYVYRGKKSYSGERDSNKKSVLVKAGQTKEFELKNIVSEAEPGDYKLKIKIKRDDQKTEKEITQEIKVFQGKIEEKEEKIELKEKGEEDYYTALESTKQPEIIYESSSIKAEKLAVYFFIGLLLIYSAVLTWKR